MNLVVATIFSLGVLMMIASIVIYSKADQTAGYDALEKTNANTAQIKYLESVITGIQNSHAAIVAKITNIDEEYTNLRGESILVGSELNLLKQRCDHLKESQINIQDKLSNKRPVVYLKEAPKSQVSVDLIGKAGLEALLKPRGKKTRELNEQK